MIEIHLILFSHHVPKNTDKYHECR